MVENSNFNEPKTSHSSTKRFHTEFLSNIKENHQKIYSIYTWHESSTNKHKAADEIKHLIRIKCFLGCLIKDKNYKAKINQFQ